ncbi:pyridoxal phosphate-dependent aminotransferase [Gallaecimonas pentaromativorans]|uniref:pyridoxal phosphate-dependent aminotransferase n=1 Tax=Gallaecimonas pentaromativorans TaxID=584787 RepID=UPI00067F0213|nr:histidinol-phosphate transaminase [Gallaecimonas pentaromativorans]
MNKFVSFLKPYKLASHKIWEVEDKSKILKLDWNEATVEPSPKVLESIIEAAADGTFRYYPDVMNKILLESISLYAEIPSDFIQYFPSSDVAHEYIVRALINEDDDVLMLAPTYDNFRTTCESLGGRVTFSLLRNNREFRIEEFSSLLRKNNPKIAYICNPNNPTGTVIEKDIIEQLVSNHKETFFLIDEAYYEFYGESSKDLVTKYTNIIVTRTFSKAFGLAGMRIGYIFSSEIILAQINKIRNAKNIQHLSQVAACAALKDIPYMKGYVNEVNLAKKVFEKELKSMSLGIRDIIVGSGNFILLDVEDVELKRKLITYLESHNIFVRNLSHMEAVKNCIRITIGTREQMQRVSDILKDFHA